MSKKIVSLNNLGTVVATQGMSGLIENHQSQLTDAMRRHVGGDWGIVGDEDTLLNDESAEALNEGHADRVLSVYMIEGEKIWIITEGDKANRVTTLLLPSEY